MYGRYRLSRRARAESPKRRPDLVRMAIAKARDSVAVDESSAAGRRFLAARHPKGFQLRKGPPAR